METRTMVQVFAILVPTMGGLISIYVLLANDLVRVEERVNGLQAIYINAQELAQDVSEVKTMNNALQIQLGKYEADCDLALTKIENKITLNRIERNDELKTVRKSIENARRYVREQVGVMQTEFRRDFLPHVNNSDLHPRELKIEQKR